MSSDRLNYSAGKDCSVTESRHRVAIVNDTDPALNIEYGGYIAEVMIKSLGSSRTGRRLKMLSTF